MEDCDLDEPWWYWPDEDPYKEQEIEPMRTSYKLSGPYRTMSGEVEYELHDDDGKVVGSTYHRDPSEALSRALEMAAAPSLMDSIEAALRDPEVNWRNLRDAYAEAKGCLCETCEKLGQPSRMVFSPTNRLYHPECVTPEVQAQIDAEKKAADEWTPF